MDEKDVRKVKEKAGQYLDAQVELLREFSKVDCESKDVEGTAGSLTWRRRCFLR